MTVLIKKHSIGFNDKDCRSRWKVSDSILASKQACFIPVESHYEEGLVELLRRIVELVVQGERRAEIM